MMKRHNKAPAGSRTFLFPSDRDPVSAIAWHVDRVDGAEPRVTDHIVDGTLQISSGDTVLDLGRSAYDRNDHAHMLKALDRLIRELSDYRLHVEIAGYAAGFLVEPES